jgi:pimeloyl-ACP methyl ester carboxylesterase
MKPPVSRLGFLLAILSACPVTTVAAPRSKRAASVGLRSCSIPGVERRARCGAIEVLENPDRPGCRQLQIHFAVIPSVKGHAYSDPIVPLLGGPGESAIDAGQMLVERLAPMLKDRDLLLVDERGAGKSGALRCHFFSLEILLRA